MSSKGRSIIPYLAALAGTALVTALCLPLRDRLDNSPAIALVQLFVVILVAIRWGRGPALVAAVSGMVTFNFFFLEPYHTFVISGYDDIVFYLVFFVISLAVGNLSAQAKRRADLAESRMAEIERLYADLQRESSEREQAEEDVRRLNAELRQKVVQLQAAQEALRQENEAKYRSLVNNIPDVVWTSDSTGRTVFISANFERLSGYPVSEVYEKSSEFWFEGIHPDDLPLVQKAYEELITRNVMFDIEYRFRKKNGTWMWVHDRAVAAYERDGMIYVDGMFTDITGRKQAMEELARSRERLAKAQQIARLGNWEWDIAKDAVTYSDEIYHIFGTGWQETFNSYEGFLEAVHPEDREMVAGSVRAAVDEGRPYSVDHRIVWPDGTVRIVHEEGEVLRDATGQALKMVGTVQDITAQKRTEGALQKSRDFCLTLFDSFPTPIWRSGLDKGCDYFNKTWLEFTGRRMGQELGEGWVEGVHPDDLARCVAGYQQAFDRREPFRLEYRLRHHSGEYRWLIDFGRPFYDLEGEFAGYIGSCYDATEQREAAEKIRQMNAELEQKVAERTSQLLAAQEELVRKEKLSILGQLSGSVGHELRNPLGIMGNAVYFLKMVLPEADEDVKEYLGIIENEVANSERIITDLLDFARTKPPQRQRIAPVALVRQSLPRCTIPQSVTLHVEVAENLPKLNVDPLQMGEVLMNLVTNGVQAMPEGGELTITGEAVDTMVRLAVRDTGTGITPENMSKLFQPLFTTKPRGIGLGLVVCKNLVEANGGTIEVTSETGQGTTFTVALPAIKSGE